MRAALVAFFMMIAVVARADDLTGTWAGAIELPGQALAFSVTFTAGGATIDIPDQGAKALALANVHADGRKVQFDIAKVGAAFTGTRDGDTITGTISQGGQTFPFKLARAVVYAPPEPPSRPLTEHVGQALLGTWRGALADGTEVEARFWAQDGLVVGGAQTPRTCRPPAAVKNIAMLGDGLTLAVDTDPTSYFEGKLAGDTLTGTMHRAGVNQAVTMQRAAPEPARPYTEIEIDFPSTGSATLAATLTEPTGAQASAKVPVVVMVTGSGPQDRDECVFGVRPFRQLADALARAGIATLRYDDRGIARSSGDFAAATPADFADDAEAALIALAKRPEIDASHLGILGHSEGGIVAPIVAARSKRVAFIVLWAGPALPFDKVIAQQIADIGKAEGQPADAIARDVAVSNLSWRALAAAKDEASFRAALRTEAGKSLTKVQLAALGPIDAWLDSQVHELWAPWARWYVGYDPAKTLAKVTVPVLAINGEMDRQVDAATNLPAIGKALAHDKDVKLVKLPGLNHLFQPTQTGAVSEYAKNPPVVDPSVLEATTQWLLLHR